MGFVRRHRVLGVVAMLVAAMAAIPVATATAVWRAAHTDDARRIHRVDVIAVLGAAQYNGHPSPTFVGRLEQAELLYNERFATTVLVLGGKQPGDSTTEADAGRDWLLAQGLPAGSVFAEPVGNDTLASLEAASSFMRSRHLRSVFLVSDPWHNLRIRRMASDLGLAAFVSATWHSAARSQWTRLSGYTRETLAYLHYRLLGR